MLAIIIIMVIIIYYISVKCCNAQIFLDKFLPAIKMQRK